MQQRLVRSIALLRRRSTFDRSKFTRYWRDQHGPFVVSSPNYAELRRRYSQSHIVQTFGEFAFDGVADVLVPLATGVATEAQRTLAARLAGDEAVFLDRRACLVAPFAIETWCQDVDGPFKLMVFSAEEDDRPSAEAVIQDVAGNCGQRRSRRIGDWKWLDTHVGPVPLTAIDLVLEVMMASEVAAVEAAQQIVDVFQANMVRAAVVVARELVFFESGTKPGQPTGCLPNA